MKKNLSFALIVFGIILVFAGPLVFGVTTTQTIHHYNFSGGTSSDSNIYKTESILLKITTNNYTSCYYAHGSGTPSEALNNYGLVHEKELKSGELEDGVHEYNIRCENGPIMKIYFTTKIPVYAEYVGLSEDSPLKSGTYEIELKTSKPLLETPELKYTFDNIVEKKIPLEGSEENWRGYLVIPDSLGEVVGSFKFYAKDLDETITVLKKIDGNSIFMVDTVKPGTINFADATGYEGKINLNWYYEEDVEFFKIYRGENPNIDKTDYYKDSYISGSDYEYGYTDTGVEKGKTYYYKIAAVDEAGNVGELSPEIYATALISETQSSKTGLNVKLLGRVDNFVTEVNYILGYLESAKSSLESGTNKNIYEELKLSKEIESAKNELDNLKRDTEKYKSQDLSEDELNRKINSASLKLDVIRKKIPENIIVLEEKTIENVLSEEVLQKVFLEYDSSGDSSAKNVKEVQKIIEERNLKIERYFANLEIVYIDGTRKEITFVRENLNSGIERSQDLHFVLVVPKNIAEDASEIKIINTEYEIIKSDPVLSFPSDSKKIIYYFEKDVSLSALEETDIAPVKEIESENQGITGNFIGNVSTGGSAGIIILFLVVLGLVFYFVYLRKNNGPRNVLIVLEKIKKVKELKDEGKNDEAMELYKIVKEGYSKLSDKDKNLALNEIQKIGLK